MNLIKIERLTFYFILNIFKPLLKPIFRHFKIFDFAVLVYAGTRNDVGAYFSFEFFRKVIPIISIVGFIKKGENGKRGIIIAIKYYIEEIYDKKEKISKVVKEFAVAVGVEKVALVGRLPKILFDKENSLFVEGKTGTVFSVIDSIKTLMLKLGLPYDKTNIGVIGVGFIGKEVLINLREMKFASIIGVDSRFEEDRVIEDNIIKGRDPSLLNGCDLVIILTSRGDDIENLIPFLRNNVIILDDTHPFISKKIIKRIEDEKNGKIYKVAVILPGATIFPKIPGFRNNWIPGCVVETIVFLYNKEKWANQNQFDQIAREIGFYAIFEKITEENSF